MSTPPTSGPAIDRVRIVETSKGLAWGPLHTLANPLTGMIALSPAGTRIAGLRAYEGARRRRTARAQETAHKQGTLYGRSGPEALIRNLGMKMLGGERLRSRYDWIYTWRPPEETGSLA